MKNLGKPELKLAYKAGALSIINRQGVELDEETKSKMMTTLDKEFEEWYQAMEGLMKLL